MSQSEPLSETDGQWYALQRQLVNDALRPLVRALAWGLPRWPDWLYRALYDPPRDVIDGTMLLGMALAQIRQMGGPGPHPEDLQMLFDYARSDPWDTGCVWTAMLNATMVTSATDRKEPTFSDGH